MKRDISSVTNIQRRLQMPYDDWRDDDEIEFADPGGRSALRAASTSNPQKRNSPGQGVSHHPLWGIFGAMHDRCYRKKDHSYKDYGGRGIKVCTRWSPRCKESFLRFVEDIPPRPEGRTPSGKRPLYWLDRINNDGNYEPGNIKWSTTKESAMNKRPPNPDVMKRRWAEGDFPLGFFKGIKKKRGEIHNEGYKRWAAKRHQEIINFIQTTNPTQKEVMKKFGIGLGAVQYHAAKEGLKADKSGKYLTPTS